MQVDLVLSLVGPGVLGVKDLGVDPGNGLGVLHVEDWHGLELSLGQGTVVDGVNDVASGLDADALSEMGNTLP